MPAGTRRGETTAEHSGCAVPPRLRQGFLWATSLPSQMLDVLTRARKSQEFKINEEFDIDLHHLHQTALDDSFRQLLPNRFKQIFVAEAAFRACYTQSWCRDRLRVGPTGNNLKAAIVLAAGGLCQRLQSQSTAAPLSAALLGFAG